MSNIKELTNEIINSYIDFRKKYGGIKVTEEVINRAAKAAAVCEKLNIDGITYIKAVEHCLPSKVKKIFPPFPISCIDTKHAEKYIQSYLKIFDNENFEDLYLIQVNYLKSSVELLDRTVEETLLDVDIDFQAWFRVLITKEINEDILAIYGKEAVNQLQNEKLKNFCFEKKILNNSKLCQLIKI